MATFDSIESALKFIESGVNASMGTLEKELKEEQTRQASWLYSAYSPRSGYKRRHTLLNPSIFHVTKRKVSNGFELEGESFVRGRNGIRLDEILTRGKAPHWRNVPARPWLKKTEQEFKSIAELVVRESLQKQGIL